MDADDMIVGPASLPCELGCKVPDGAKLVPVPMPRHTWSDVLVCPNKGCGRAWLVIVEDDGAGEP
jgi:hypothetical protein